MSGGNDARAEGQGRIYQSSGDQHIIEHHYHDAKGFGSEWPGLDSVRWPPVGRAPVVLRDRAELMDRLRAAVSADPGGQVYVLHGLGGCGKTAVAHALFRYATSEAGRVGLWVNASDTASLRRGMLAVAADRGAGEAELTAAHGGLRAAADLVWDHLDRSDRPWLLVLDNADDPSVLRDGGWLRTSPRGMVLVTTRQAAAHWWPGAELLHVGVLPKEDAARVLCDLAPAAGTVEEAEAVAERLGRLPLALTLAGGFLAHQVIAPWTMAEYGHNLDNGQGLDPIELLDQGAVAAGGSDSRHLVSSTWKFSLNALVRQNLPESVTLLRLLACWSGDPLPLSLLSGVNMGDALPGSRVELALRGLLDQSLTEVVPGSLRCLRTHGVLLDSVWRGVPPEERELLAATAARQLLSSLPEVPQRGDRDLRTSLTVPHAVRLMQRVVNDTAVSDSTVESVAESLLRLVVALHRLGEYAPALNVAESAVEIGTRRLGADHPAVLRIRERNGRALFRLGRFDESEAVLRETLKDCERVLGVDAPDTLTCCLGLMRPLHPLGRTAEAVALARRAAAGRNAVHGPTHPLTLLAKVTLLARGYLPQQEWVPYVDDCRRVLGPDHGITLNVVLDHAFALLSCGQPSEALPVAQEALRLFLSNYGAEYPLTLNARATLARTHAALGQMAQAIEHMGTVADMRVRILGPSHPWTLLAQKDLAKFQVTETQCE